MLENVIGEGRIRRLASWLIWPSLYAGGLSGTYFALGTKTPLICFNAVYLSVALAVGILERVMPFEESWLKPDGQTLNNLAHTVLTKGAVQIGAATVATSSMAAAMTLEPVIPTPLQMWPNDWPLATQLVLGLVLAELGLYTAHRIAHERRWFWRFHALHHSVERLWVINTGRFHFMDTVFKIALGQTPLYLLGAPLPVFLWFSAITAFTGLLIHCNIDVRTGPLDYVFSTPALHRWHHSKVLAEGNRNCGENLVIWDLLLGTYYRSARRPPADIGIHGHIAPGFLGQLVQPFTRNGVRAIHGLNFYPALNRHHPAPPATKT